MVPNPKIEIHDFALSSHLWASYKIIIEPTGTTQISYKHAPVGTILYGCSGEEKEIIVPKGNHKGYPYGNNARYVMREKRFCIEIPFAFVGAILYGCPLNWEKDYGHKG